MEFYISPQSGQFYMINVLENQWLSVTLIQDNFITGLTGHKQEPRWTQEKLNEIKWERPFFRYQVNAYGTGQWQRLCVWIHQIYISTHDIVMRILICQ